MKTVKIFLGAFVAAAICSTVSADDWRRDHSHHGGSDGVVLASQIVGLVRNVIAPPTVIVRESPAIVVQQPVYVQQPTVIYSQPTVIYPQPTVIYAPPRPVYYRNAPSHGRPCPPPFRDGRR